MNGRQTLRFREAVGAPKYTEPAEIFAAFCVPLGNQVRAEVGSTCDTYGPMLGRGDRADPEMTSNNVRAENLHISLLGMLFANN